MKKNATPENAGAKQAGRFQKGQSGNAKGKPKGCKHHATRAALTLLEGEAQALTRRAIELALEGDIAALRLCLERLIPPAKERALPILELPESDKLKAILGYVLEGQITLTDALRLKDLIGAGEKDGIDANTPLPLYAVSPYPTKEPSHE